MNFSIDFPRAYSESDKPLSISAHFRQQADDFYVEESLGFDLSGEGEHLCLYIEKIGNNTHWVAEQLALFAGISAKDVGVCGRKDRHAVTRQWFSLYDPERKAIDWKTLSVDGVSILNTTRHNKKLRLGDHQTNRFIIRLRDVKKTSANTFLDAIEKDQVLETITTILQQGVPNYFGEQRFGREANNLVLANDWLVNANEPPRKQRSMVLSAARSYLFNRVLASRVLNDSWNKILEGEVLSNDLPTGPLWGRGRLNTSKEVLEIEQAALLDYSHWCERMEHRGLQQERRPLILLPSHQECHWENDDLILSFTLPVGTFATAVLAEIIELNNLR